MVDSSYSKFIKMMELVFLISGIILLFLGSGGLVISITFYNVGFFRDDVTSFAFGFLNFFMSILGIFLILFRGKILVEPKPQ